VPKATEKLFTAFVARIRRLDSTRRRVDALTRANRLSARVAEQVYESLFLSAFTAFEVFVEELFLVLLVGPPTAARANSAAVPRVAVRSFSVARDLVLGPGRKYVDWLPYERTIARAEVFFRGGRPFTDVLPADRDLINRAHIVRNVIAHHSRHSEERFARDVIAGTALAPRERRPAGYLRGLHSVAPAICRYESYATGLLGLAKRLAR
jgi:hypothetical protein